jgi:D-alanyl-lipoteichoic acid acyltransferase DltB (MBOAT superfamily)
MIVLYYVFPKKYRYLVLLVESCIFYYISSGIRSIYLVVSVLSVYLLGLLINKENKKIELISEELSKEEKKAIKGKIKKTKRLIVTMGVLFNFGILVVLKYSGFLVKIFNNLFSSNFTIIKFILPLGISYYTLMAVSYIIDVYRGKIEGDKNFFRLFLYLTFFPQMLEGPIANYSDTANKLYEGHKFNIDNLLKGTFRIFLGVFKTLVIAHRAGVFVDNLFDSNVTGPIIFLGAIMYTIQIYADFSGCMDIVCGTANLFDIDLPENFKRPFFSRSVQEFWRRWHITLGAWIKNYIFYPVSLSKFNTKVTEFFEKHLPKWLSSFLVVGFPLLFVWLFCGIWHGASYKYVLYGMYYFVLIMIGLILTPLLKKIRSSLKINEENFFFKLYEMIRTSFLVFFGMLMFRCQSFTAFTRMIVNMFKKSNTMIMNLGLDKYDFRILIVYLVVLLFVGIYKEKHGSLYEKISKSNVLIQYAVWAVIMLGIVIFGLYGAGYDTSSFIYGDF